MSASWRGYKTIGRKKNHGVIRCLDIFLERFHFRAEVFAKCRFSRNLLHVDGDLGADFGCRSMDFLCISFVFSVPGSPGVKKNIENEICLHFN